MNQKLGQLAFLALLLCIPLFVFYDIATRFAAEGVASGSAENNAAMYPRLVALLLLFLILIQGARTLLERSVSAGRGADLSLAALTKYRRSVAVFILFLLYLSAFRWFGFMIATPLFLVSVQFVLGYRNVIAMALYSGGVTMAIWFAFSKILNLVLPAGDIFG